MRKISETTILTGEGEGVQGRRQCRVEKVVGAKLVEAEVDKKGVKKDS